jgi:hypothetical protein
MVVSPSVCERVDTLADLPQAVKESVSSAPLLENGCVLFYGVRSPGPGSDIVGDVVEWFLRCEDAEAMAEARGTRTSPLTPGARNRPGRDRGRADRPDL